MLTHFGLQRNQDDGESMILILGGKGQLGSCLRDKFQCSFGEVTAPGRDVLDITDASQTMEFFERVRPDVVVHCAAFTQVDRAEEESELCRRINIDGTRNVADACQKSGAYLLFLSTDYVFDGQKNGPYEVCDEKKPLSVYGQSKAVAEEIVLETCENSAVLRTSWLFGHSEHNFLEKIMRASQSAAELKVVSDQIGSPTYTEDLAVLIEQLIRKRAKGIYHGTNEGVCSWAAFAVSILSCAGRDTVVKEVATGEYPAIAVRPLNSVLSKASLDRLGIPRLPHWEDALKRYFEKRERVDHAAY